MGDALRVLERGIEAWNAHDREGWTALFSEEASLSAPGGVAGSRADAARLFFSIWQDAFPDNQIETVTLVEAGHEAVLEGVFKGTHTGPLCPPGAEIPATGRSVAIPIANMNTVREGRFTSFRLYFDQVELLSQLGLAPPGGEVAGS
jgi:predicted ester cyclase